MQQSLPQNLNYNDVKPIGFPSHVRQEKYTPIAFNTSTNGVSSQDVIRFNISTNGFWDPYSAYIKLEVDVSNMDGAQHIGSQQIDNSASSFINQLIVYKGGTEIERIEEYDTLAAILNDMNCSNDNRVSRLYEGMYSQNTPAGLSYSNPVHNIFGQAIQGYKPFTIYEPGYDQAVSYNASYLGSSANNVYNRYDYTLNQYDGRNTVQSTSDTIKLIKNANNPANIRLDGYKMAFNSSLSSYGYEPLLSNNVFQMTTYKGKLSNKTMVNRQTFCIPLISGLLGVLMPKESYKYIPMKALQELILEFRLNPYAMFTSGYADNSHGDVLKTTTNPMLSRIWKITKFDLNVEVQYFEPQIENIILSQLNTDRGIVIHSQSWMLGPRYQMAANSTPQGTYQVNLGFESLKNVVWIFQPDDYQSFTFCRKQYRLSANITSMYIKIGSEYYPPLPITGHGGNATGYQSLTNDTDASNSEYLINLYKTFGKFNDIQTNCIVNPINFAVNSRAYNPANVNTFVSGNDDTAISQSLFHENRCVGRAIYAMNLETLNQDYSVISGINTINNRPFEITLKSDNTNPFERPYNMVIFCQYDMLIQLRTSGVQILGRG